MNNALAAWLLDAGTWLGLALWLACVVYGLALILVPAATLRASAHLNRRYSGRRATRALEIPRSTERFFYRHHRVVGSLLLAGVVAFFLAWFLDFPRDTVLAKLGRVAGRPLAGVLLESLEVFLVIANAMIGIFAAVMVLRPSALKPLEIHANRWLSTRRALRRIEEDRRPLDALVHGFPRAAGCLVLLGAGYIAASLLVAL